MSIDLSDMMEEKFPSEPEPKTSVPNRGSLVVPIDKKADDAIALGAKIDAKQMVAELAGSEQISHWAELIAQWMQQRSCGEAVSLLGLQQALGMPLLNIWLGLLLPSEHRYDWERSGDFYSDAGEIRLKQKQLSH